MLKSSIVVILFAAASICAAQSPAIAGSCRAFEVENGVEPDSATATASTAWGFVAGRTCPAEDDAGIYFLTMRALVLSASSQKYNIKFMIRSVDYPTNQGRLEQLINRIATHGMEPKALMAFQIKIVPRIEKALAYYEAGNKPEFDAAIAKTKDVWEKYLVQSQGNE